ncbi:MAG: DUF1761 domain-containing protein [Anaerolineae bacterium]|nr:DUF1761 domain-containing protein [Anaerolineae bacterium]
MDFSSINWLAVVACVVVSMISGFLWYHPKTFFPAWWKGIGKSESDAGMEGAGVSTWLLTIIAAFIQAVFVSLFLTNMGSNTLATGMQAGFVIWLGVIAPTNLVNKLFAGHGLKVWAIEAGNHLVNMLLFGAILASWQ